MPAGAKIIIRKGQRLAQWQDAKGKTRTAPLTVAGDRIAVEAGTYTAKYRDGSGIVRKITTGCQDKTAAESVLADLERRAEKVKGGILTPAEDTMIDYQETPLDDHVVAYRGWSATGSRRRKLQTGTDDLTPSPLVPTSGKPCILGSTLDRVTDTTGESTEAGTVAASAYPVKGKSPLTIAVNGLHQERAKGFEPSTGALGRHYSTTELLPQKVLISYLPTSCNMNLGPRRSVGHHQGDCSTFQAT